MSSFIDSLGGGEEVPHNRGRFKKGESGNPNGRPRRDSEGRRLEDPDAGVVEEKPKNKGGRPKKGLNFKPVTSGITSVEDSVDRNKLPFLNAIWEEIAKGSPTGERLQVKMMELVMNGRNKNNSLQGIPELNEVSVEELQGIVGQLKEMNS